MVICGISEIPLIFVSAYMHKNYFPFQYQIDFFHWYNILNTNAIEITSCTLLKFNSCIAALNA